jgi:hypothetical protein
MPDELPVRPAGEIGATNPITVVEMIAITVPIRTGKIALESDADMWKE